MVRSWYEVRVREEIGPDRYVKKSRFFEANSSHEASSKYKGPGHIMWAVKASREKVLGIGEFFTLGNTLLREFRTEAIKASALKAHGVKEVVKEGDVSERA